MLPVTFFKKYDLEVTTHATTLSSSSVLKLAYKSLISSPVQRILSPHLDDMLKDLRMQLLGQHRELQQEL